MSLTNESVADVLKRETAVRHAETEKLLLPKLSGIRTYSDYSDILSTFYGFFSPLQQRTAEQIGEDLLSDIKQRRHAGYILHDLSAIGYTGTPDTCPHLPHIPNTASAFGALYVMEGSTLGGRMIAGMLKKNQYLPLNDSQLHFFNGYGQATGAMWNHFRTVLNRQAGVDEMVHTANETFLHLKNWMKHTLYATSYSPE